MKIKNTQQAMDTVQTIDVTENHPVYSFLGQDPASQMQKAVYDMGMNYLKRMEASHSNLRKEEAYHQLKVALQKLHNFSFNIGFAGIQSCGKSTVINSLLGYPLMPTCKLTTTATVVSLKYGDTIRLTATDYKTRNCVLDIDCGSISPEHFRMLKEYAVAVQNVAVLDHLQYFLDKSVNAEQYTADDLKMDYDNPRHVAVLLLILLSVYIGQNESDSNLRQAHRDALNKRADVMRSLNMPLDVLNYKVQLTWQNPLINSGLCLTDLPGSGADVHSKNVNGEEQMDHNQITNEAIASTDYMVFICLPEVHAAGMDAVENMIQHSVLKNSSILPLMNQADRVQGRVLDLSLERVALNLSSHGAPNLTAEDIRPFSAIYGEYGYEDFQFTRSLYYHRYCDQDMDEDELEYMQTRLKKLYKNSGVEALREYFLNNFLQRGKHALCVNVLHAMQTLNKALLAPAEAEAEALKIIDSLGNEVINKMMGSFKEDVASMINSSMIRVKSQTDAFTTNSNQLSDKLDRVVASYTVEYETALADFREHLLETTKQFELTLWNRGWSANISEGENVKIYNTLLQQIKSFQVGLKEINQAYKDILDEIAEKMDALFNLAIKEAEIFKQELPVKMAAIVQKYENEESLIPVLQQVYNMRDVLTKYVDQQVSNISSIAQNRAQQINDCRVRMVNSIMAMNEAFLGNNRKNMQGLMNKILRSGMFDADRKLLRIKDDPIGNVGLVTVFGNLTLTDNDKAAINAKMSNLANNGILLQQTQWVSDTCSMANGLFVELVDTTDAMFDELKTTFDADSNARAAKLIALMEEIRSLNEEAAAQRKEQQALLETIDTPEFRALYAVCEAE